LRADEIEVRLNAAKAGKPMTRFCGGSVGVAEALERLFLGVVERRLHYCAALTEPLKHLISEEQFSGADTLPCGKAD
jgi:hypothetical protein